eukprot:scaffold7017_cov134-Cylindrotheca_fusiformis.AAC.21
MGNFSLLPKRFVEESDVTICMIHRSLRQHRIERLFDTNNKTRETGTMMRALLFSWIIVSIFVICARGFLVQNQRTGRIRPRTILSQSLVSLEQSFERKVDSFQGWAAECGVQAESGFQLVGEWIDGNEDYHAVTSTGGAQGSRVLFVPGEMVMSSARIEQEYQGYADLALQVLEEKGYIHLYQQFYLFLKVLMEYEQGTNSPYYPWMESLPRKWNTAVSFDYFCMSTLPPYIKKVCTAEREQLSAFQEALKAFDYVSPESKEDKLLMQFAYNVVFTRCWQSDDSGGAGGGDYRIAPVADYFNHDYPDNVAICYNENGDCEVFLKEDVAPGSPLTLSYGMPTNPSLLLAKYGFLNESPVTYCKLLFTNPSQKLKNVGYDPDRLLFSTVDGSISPEVWDVVLYSKLERAPGMAEAKNAFYEACMNGDEATKFAIHSQFQEATCSVLLEHVDGILKEVAQLTTMMENFRNEEKHPRLPLLLKHHAMVTSTFSKVRENILGIMSGG